MAPTRSALDGNLSWLREATVRLDFVGGELATRQRPTRFDDFYADQVVNYGQGMRFRRPAAQPSAQRADTVRGSASVTARIIVRARVCNA